MTTATKQRKEANNTRKDTLLPDGSSKPVGERSAGAGTTLSNFVPPDGGWGWIVCIASLWVNGIVFGILNSYGILYVSMLKKYGAGDPNISFKTSWVGSVTIGMTFLMSIFASILADRIGIRKVGCFGGLLCTVGLVSSAFVEKLELLYLTYGIFLGIGGAFVYSPSLVILGHYFKKHMGLVNGFVSFGSAIFSIVFSQVLPLLLHHLELRFTLLVLAGLEFSLIFCAMTWKPLIIKESNLARVTMSTESIYEHVTDCCSWTKKFLNVDIWTNRGYVVWSVSCAVALFGYFVPFVHLMKYTEDVFPGHNGPILLLFLNITSGLGRLAFGKLADVPGVSRIRLQQLAFLAFGATTMCIPFAKSFGALIGIVLLMGICDGIFICLLGPIAYDIVGPAGASQAIGFLLGTFSLPLMCGPPMAGLMYDHMKTYNIAFHVAGTPPILGSLLMFFIPKVKQTLPAVTQADEFAAVSMTDIMNESHATFSQSVPSHKNVELIVVKPDDYAEPMLLTHIVENCNDEKTTNEHMELSTSPKESLLNHSPQPV